MDNFLFDPEEINDLLDNLSHRDTNRKELGDRVQILDYSSCTHMNGKPLDYEEDDEMSFNFVTEFIVIETDCQHIYDAYYKKYKQNLIIVNPITNKRYRINSGHVQLR
jgi:hypothetical protein